jgi:hypothetical protein
MTPATPAACASRAPSPRRAAHPAARRATHQATHRASRGASRAAAALAAVLAWPRAGGPGLDAGPRRRRCRRAARGRLRRRPRAGAARHAGPAGGLRAGARGLAGRHHAALGRGRGRRRARASCSCTRRWAGCSWPPGEPVRAAPGRPQAIALAAVADSPAAAALPASDAVRRFSHIGAGPTLAVAAADAARLRAWHRGQLTAGAGRRAGPGAGGQRACRPPGRWTASTPPRPRPLTLGSVIRGARTHFGCGRRRPRAVALCLHEGPGRRRARRAAAPGGGHGRVARQRCPRERAPPTPTSWTSSCPARGCCATASPTPTRWR